MNEFLKWLDDYIEIAEVHFDDKMLDSIDLIRQKAQFFQKENEPKVGGSPTETISVPGFDLGVETGRIWGYQKENSNFEEVNVLHKSVEKAKDFIHPDENWEIRLFPNGDFEVVYPGSGYDC